MPGGDSAFTTIGSLATGSVSIDSSVSSLATSASISSSGSPLPISTSIASSATFLPTSSPSATPSQSNKSMKVGLAVGIPLTALVFGAVAIWVFRHEHHSKKQMQKMYAHKMPSSHNNANKNLDPSPQGMPTFTQHDSVTTPEGRFLYPTSYSIPVMPSHSNPVTTSHSSPVTINGLQPNSITVNGSQPNPATENELSTSCH